MKKTKRFISMLLALVMTLSVIFIGAGDSILTAFATDPPIVPRFADEQAPAGFSFTVPEVLNAYGSSPIYSGTNVSSGQGNVTFSLTLSDYTVGNKAYTNISVSNINLTARDDSGVSGISFGEATYPNDYTVQWPVSGGTVGETASYVIYTLTYTYEYTLTVTDSTGSTVLSQRYTKNYITTGVSAIKQGWSPATNRAHLKFKINSTTRDAWMFFDFCAINSLGNVGNGSGVKATGHYDPSTGGYTGGYSNGGDGANDNWGDINSAGSCFCYSNGWDSDENKESTMHGSSGTEVHFPSNGEQTGLYVVDKAKISNLSESHVQIGYRTYDDNGVTVDDTHRITVSTELRMATINGNAVGDFALYNNNISSNESEDHLTLTSGFSGPLPAAGSYIGLTVYLKHRLVVKRALLNAGTRTVELDTNLYLGIYVKDSTSLRALVASELSANRQAGYYTDASWATYYNALVEAAFQINNPAGLQSDLDASYASLSAAISGLQYKKADYTAVNYALNKIPSYAFTNPEYYTAESYSAVLDAYNDIDYGLDGSSNALYYDGTAATVVEANKMTALYQGVVTVMASNLSSAVNGLTYKSFDITFETNGGTAVASQTYQLFDTISQPTTTPTKAHYAFTGWYTDPELTNKITNWSTLTMPYGGMTVYAGWELTGRTVSFDTNGGSAVESYIGEPGESYTGPTTYPTKSYCDFVGWYYDNTTFENPVDWSTFTIPSTDITLYAKWEYKTYKITFNSNGGSSVSPINAQYKSQVEKPADPIKAGYGFTGWYTTSSLDTLVTWPYTMPHSNKTFYAGWDVSSYTITFHAEGGVFSDNSDSLSISSTVGSGITMPDNPTRAGYTFDAWYYADDTAVDWNDWEESGLIDVYAGWTPVKYTVSFDSNGGTAISSVQADCGSELSLAPYAPTLDRFVFAGWYFDDDTFENPAGNVLTIPVGGVTLYAKWDPEPKAATVTLKTDIPNQSSNGTVVTGSLKQGDVINVTVNLATNYIVGSHSAIVYYDSRYFEPALNGESFSTAINATAAAITSGFITLNDNTSTAGIDYNITGNGSAVGKVNVQTPLPAFYPAEWRSSATALKSDYANYRYVMASVAQNASSTNGGYSVEANPAQDLFTFQLKVINDAPVTSGSDYASIIIPQEAVRTDTNTYTKNMKLYATATSANTYSATNTLELYDIGYTLVDNDIRLQIAASPKGTINFDSDGGSSVDSITEIVGKTITLPTPTKADYTFTGWSDGTNIVDSDSFVVPSGTTNLTATWLYNLVEYKVRHHKQNVDGNGYDANYEEETFTGNIGDSVTPTAKTYTGFTAQSVSAVTLPANNDLVIDIYYNRNSHTITFNSNGGTSVAKITALYGATVTEPTAPRRNGYQFDGWYNGDTLYTFSTMPDENLTLTAHWTQLFYDVTFYNGNDVIQTMSGNAYGSTVTLPTNPTTPENYKFIGWYVDADLTAAYASTTYTVTANKSFYGKFELDASKVSLYVNGSLVGTVDVINGQTLTQAAIDGVYTVPAGYDLSAWQTSGGDAVTIPYTVTADTSLYATTSLKSISYYFFINTSSTDSYVFADGTDGQSFAPDYTVTANYGDVFAAPTVPSRTGYTFSGWYTDKALTQAADIPSTMPETGAYIYGTYVAQYATITFDANGATGTAPQAVSVMVGSQVELPEATGLTKTNYVFAGWSTTKSVYNIVTSYTAPEGGATLYAIWTQKYVNVSFDLDGGTGSVAAINAASGSEVTLPSADGLSKTNYVFGGWSLTKGGEAISSYTATESDATLYAVWNRKYVDITFDLTGGSGTATGVTVAAGSEVTLPDGSDFVRANYVFKGWALTDGGEIINSYTATEQNAVLYAVWERAEMNIVPTAGTNSPAKISDMKISGVEEKLTLDRIGDFIEVSGDGRIEITPTGAYIGTGCIVSLVDNQTGAVVKEYSIVIFGDLDGDGVITASDQTLLKKAVAGTKTLTDAQTLAADVNHDGIVDSSDYALMKRVLKGQATVDQIVAA